MTCLNCGDSLDEIGGCTNCGDDAQLEDLVDTSKFHVMLQETWGTIAGDWGDMWDAMGEEGTVASAAEGVCDCERYQHYGGEPELAKEFAKLKWPDMIAIAKEALKDSEL